MMVVWNKGNGNCKKKLHYGDILKLEVIGFTTESNAMCGGVE